MSMQFTGLQVVSWILLLVGNGMLIIASVSDFWSVHTPRNQMDGLVMNRGIIRQCISTKQYGSCDFRLASIFKQLRNLYDTYAARTIYRHMPAKTFEVFVVLFISISISVATVVLTFGPFCCQKCKAATTLLILITGVFSAAGCFIYWTANREGNTFTLQHMPFEHVFHYDYGSDENLLSWSFYLAASSAAFLLISAFLLCISSRVDPDIEYEPAASSPV
ncbi:unnamed protein product [Caenorhabditis auriculariae]|uniref:Uncharacterized protein n=1 Tax=Caenorhabditis auriculariae TaxID=2777116 RepID=A0A8S1GUT9_9PELO|nr:unnamed protein product [Caenorhabditis auriculariae]